MELRTLDLNLLRVLWVLIREKNTYRAAEKLHTSQPAVSRSLGRLRKEFDDQLFVRDKQGLKLTAKAEELATKLPNIFSDIQDLIDGEEFNFAKLKGKLRIGLNTYIMELYGSKLFSAFSQYCPDLQLELFSFDQNTLSKIQDNSIELAITLDDIKLSKEVYNVSVGKFDYVLICQKGLFPENTQLDFDTCVQYPYAGIIMPELNNERFRNYKAKHKEVNLVFRSQQVTPILEVLLKAPVMYPAPVQLFNHIDQSKYQKIDISDYQISDNICLIFNNKHYKSVKYTWFEQVIREVLEE